jgi:hypothetical protein
MNRTEMADFRRYGWEACPNRTARPVPSPYRARTAPKKSQKTAKNCPYRRYDLGRSGGVLTPSLPRTVPTYLKGRYGGTAQISSSTKKKETRP